MGLASLTALLSRPIGLSRFLSTTTTPVKDSQRSYSAAVAEVVTINLVPGDGGVFDTSQSDTNGNSVSWTAGTLTYSASPGIGWSVTSGSGTATVTFTADTTGPKNSVAVLSPGNTSPTPLTIDVTGADEVTARVVVSWNGVSGYFTWSEGALSFNVDITSSEAAALATFNDAANYNGNVASVTVSGSTMTVTFGAGISISTVTIGGSVQT